MSKKYIYLIFRVIIKEYDNGKYIGEWNNDIKEGKGIFYHNNGDIYDGEFKNDKKEGKGIFYYNNGDKYEGEWKDDKFKNYCYLF